MADKARYFLEQGIPELKDLERKKIFTTEEIQSISKRRSDFEHRINASRCKPAGFVRYAEYEMNLDALRRKRVKRLAIKARSHNSQRRIFFILERATRKFHGDVALWMQYLDYAKKEKSINLLKKILTSVLRLHPAKPELWIYAARTALDENFDTAEARSYMQRGLRFNKYSKILWLEYTKFECIFIAKILARRQLLGIDIVDANEDGVEQADDMADNDDMIALPEVPQESYPSLQEDKSLNFHTLQSIESNHALDGAIPITIFDTAMSTIPNDPSFAHSFFDLFSSFTNIQCYKTLLHHVVVYMQSTYSTFVETSICFTKEPLIGLKPTDPDYPAAFKTAISRLSTSLENLENRSKLYDVFLRYVHDTIYVERDEPLDTSLSKAVRLVLMKYLKQAKKENEMTDAMVQILDNI